MEQDAAVVLALARGGAEKSLPGTGRDINWDRVQDLAHRHEVDALCSWMWRNEVSTECESQHFSLSARVERQWREAYLHHLVRNESTLTDLASIQDVFETHNTNVLFLKGPWLAFDAYPTPGGRPMGDIDLCIGEEDYSTAVASLNEIGYAPSRSLPETGQAALREAHYGEQLRFLARGRRPVELHFRVINIGPPGNAEHWIWESSRRIPVGPNCISVPGPEAMLLHLLIHANQHGFAVLRLLHDIRWCLERDGPSLDIHLLLEQIRVLRCTATAYFSLLLARDLAGAQTPPGLLEAVRPSLVRRSVFSRAWNVADARSLKARRSLMQVESPWLYLLEMGRMRDKIRYLRGLIIQAGGLRAFFGQARRILSRPARERQNHSG